MWTSQLSNPFFSIYFLQIRLQAPHMQFLICQLWWKSKKFTKDCVGWERIQRKSTIFKFLTSHSLHVNLPYIYMLSYHFFCSQGQCTFRSRSLSLHNRIGCWSFPPLRLSMHVNCYSCFIYVWSKVCTLKQACFSIFYIREWTFSSLTCELRFHFLFVSFFFSFIVLYMVFVFLLGAYLWRKLNKQWCEEFFDPASEERLDKKDIVSFFFLQLLFFV